MELYLFRSNRHVNIHLGGHDEMKVDESEGRKEMIQRREGGSGFVGFGLLESCCKLATILTLHPVQYWSTRSSLQVFDIYIRVLIYARVIVISE